MKKMNIRKYIILILLLMTICPIVGKADSVNIADEAIEKFLRFPFQYDYTLIRDDGSFREFINALDVQLATIDYRQRLELAMTSADINLKSRFANQLESRYNELFDDGFMFSLLADWRDKTNDPVSRIFADIVLTQREESLIEPAEIYELQKLSDKIGRRLYKFRFIIDGQSYAAPEAARKIEENADMELARNLFKQQNDSAATVAADAVQLYFMYDQLGERFGHKTSFDYNLSFLSYNKSDWLEIALQFVDATEAELQAGLNSLYKATGRSDLKQYEIELILRDSAVISDSVFTAEKCRAAVEKLLSGIGIEDFDQHITRQSVQNINQPALAIKLYPPFENMLYERDQGGFEFYRRLAMETGRLLMWVYADSSLPYLLRDYPKGAEEMLTGLLEDLALDSAFLAANFEIDQEELNRFVRYDRWLRVFRIRQVILYFLFDYYLSQEINVDPVELYWSQENSLLGCPDSSYHWIETLLMGNLSRYPEWLANLFSRIKLHEALYRKFGSTWNTNIESGQFIIEQICLPGRTQTIEEIFTRHTPDKADLIDVKRQFGLQ